MDNSMRLEFSALAENEAFARAAAAALIMPLDPTVEELTEVKTAVSEAVSNCVIHGYKDPEDERQRRGDNRVIMECTSYSSGKVVILVEDHGAGIEDVDMAMQPLFTTGSAEERSGMGFTVMESFMDKLRVKSGKGKGTTVIMTKYLDIVSGI